MHDDIQKFSKELNGVFLRTIDDYSEESSYNITNISWAITEIEGGSLNAEKLISHVLKVIAAVHPVQKKASHEFIEQAIRDNIAASHIDLPRTPVIHIQVIDFLKECHKAEQKSVEDQLEKLFDIFN